MCTPRFIRFDVTGIAIGRTQVQYILAVNSKRRFRKMAEKGVFIVMAKVPPEKEDAYNRWYDEDHLPKALNRFPGVISGRRYKITDGGDGYNYIALYEYESYAKLMETAKSDALKTLVQEYNAAFGEGNRKRLFGIEIKSLIAG
jgi:antibiotic biosynthesis monooxygenase (ABM) superfamily enzyme